MNPNLIIDVRDLSIAFKVEKGENIAVDKVNFKIHKGEIMGIVGESGSGKSITAMSILKLLKSPPAIYKSGEILFYGFSEKPCDILTLNESEMQKIRGNHISMVFQEPMTSLNPVYRCGSQVLEIILQHQKTTLKDAKNKVIDLFKEVLLPDPENTFLKYPHQLSGGQKQRVMIAMALANNPALIIADEPTTALDVTVQKSVLTLLKNIRDKYNIAVIFITHDLGVVANIADKTIVMYKGNCVEQNFTNTIFHNPEHPYTKGLIACKPNINKRLKILPTVKDFLNNKPDSTYLEKLLNNEIILNERQKNHTEIYKNVPFIKVRNLCKVFYTNSSLFSFKRKEFHALKNISFDVYKGETLGLVGESGCGKTTLGRAILRLIEPSSGEIFYEEKKISALKLSEFINLRKDLQIIFQDPYSSLNPRLTIGQAIQEPMKVHKIYPSTSQQHQKTLELLVKVGLNEDFYLRYPHELSGGQRQRVVIARTLAVKPKFIICDESVSALDVSIQAQVLNLLNNLKNDFGLTYIFISHDLSVVKFLADRIIIMKEGEIIETNEADALYSNPNHPYTKKLIDAIPIL